MALLLLVKSNVVTTAIKTILELSIVAASLLFLLILADISSMEAVIWSQCSNFPLGFQAENIYQTQYQLKFCSRQYCRSKQELYLVAIFTLNAWILLEIWAPEDWVSMVGFHQNNLIVFIKQQKHIIHDLPKCISYCC